MYSSLTWYDPYVFSSFFNETFAIKKINIIIIIIIIIIMIIIIIIIIK